MTDEDAIRSTIAEYAHLADDGRFEEWAELYVEDGDLDVGGDVLHGRKALVDFMRGSSTVGSTTRIFAVPDVRVVGDQATSVANFLVVSNDMQPVSAGRVHDEWVRDPDRWRLRVRRIVLKG